MIGSVAFEHAVLFQATHMLQVFRRRHAGKLPEVLVEVRMVGIAHTVDNVGEVVPPEVLYAACGTQEARHLEHPLRRHPHMVLEHTPELPLTEAGHVGKLCRRKHGVLLYGPAHMLQAREVGAVGTSRQLAHHKVLYQRNGPVVVGSFRHTALQVLEFRHPQTVHVYIVGVEQAAGHAAHHHLHGVGLEDDEYQTDGMRRTDACRRMVLSANGGNVTAFLHTVHRKGLQAVEYPLGTSPGHHAHFVGESIGTHHPVMVDEGAEGDGGQ